jgi:predicted permease
MLKRLLQRLLNALQSGRGEPELEREIASHLSILEDEFLRRGMLPDAARRAARLTLGGIEQTKELHRDARSFRWVDDARRDLQYTVRSLRRAPTFAFVAVLTLALGIGANTAIFSLVDALLLRWLPVRDPQRLVSLYRIEGAQSGGHFSYPQVTRLAQHREIFSALCGYSDGTALNVGEPHALETTGGAWVSGDCHRTLGLLPIAGRLLTTDDDRPGAAPAAVISDFYWARKFARDPGVIGRPLLIEGHPVTIVGVTPPGFEGPTVGEAAHVTLSISVAPQLYPERASSIGPGARWLSILARPREELSREQVQARAAVAWAQAGSTASSAHSSQAPRPPSTLEVRNGATGSSALRNQYRQPLLVLMAIVGLVLAIACANVANLLLARVTVRQREISIRLAIGAGRSRIIRQLLTESALLATAGAALGIIFASWGSHFLLNLISDGIRIDGPWARATLDIAPNWRIFAFTSLVTVSTTLFVGLTPAFRAIRESPALVMNLSSARLLGPRGRLGGALVTGQVAISLVLLIGAGLFVRTLQNLRTYDRGFRHEDVLFVGVDARRAGYQGDRLRAFNQQALAFAAQLPGVSVASAAAVTPLMGGGISMPIAVNGQPVEGKEFARDETRGRVHFNLVAPRYFETLRTPIVLGREFMPSDDQTAPAVALVNEAFVREYLPRGSPLGQRVSVVGAKVARVIVGVVRDAVYERLRQTPPPTVYVPILQGNPGPTMLVVYAPGSVRAVAAAIRAELEPKTGVRLIVGTLTERLERNLSQERLMATLAGIFGGLALLLAAVGLYGLLAYTVARRTSEIGVRLALGAQRTQVLRLVMSDALRMLAFGVLAGVPAAWTGLRLVSSMLFGLTASDPATISVAVTVLMATGLLAAFIPARRATRVDPLTALRCE